MERRNTIFAASPCPMRCKRKSLDDKREYSLGDAYVSMAMGLGPRSELPVERKCRATNRTEHELVLRRHTRQRRRQTNREEGVWRGLLRSATRLAHRGRHRACRQAGLAVPRGHDLAAALGADSR